MNYLSKTPLLKLCLLLFSLLMLQPEEAEASHFRYGNITWERVTGQPYQIRFRVTQAWRRSAFSNPNVNATINTGSINTGSGSQSILLTVTSINVAEDWFYGEYTFIKTYPSVNTNYTASFGGCCRIGSPLVNNSGGNFLVSSIVTVGNNNDAPVSTVPPFISLPVNTAAATYQIPAADPNNDAITFSLTPNNSFGSGTSQPSGISITSGGLLTFNTVGKTVGQFYSASVDVTDSKGAKIQLDLMIRISAPSTPPVFDYTVTPANSTNYVLQPGQSVSFNVKASDTDPGDNVLLNAVGVPVGASFTSGSGNPITRSFSWTPTIANVGTYQVNFVAQDNAGIQTNTIVNISVSLKPNFVSPSPGTGSIFCHTPGSTITATFKAEDVDTADRVILSLATTAQSGMSFSPSLPTTAANPVSSNFTWNTTSANWGINTVVIRATDTYNETRDDSVFYIINNPPVFTTTQGNTSVTAGQTFSYTFSGSDANIAQGDAISLSHTSYPSWMSIVNNGNGTWTISGTPTLADSGTYNVTLQLEDLTNHFRSTHCGDATQTFSVTVLPCNITTGTSVTNMSAAGVNDGSIDLTVNNATAPVTYAWSNSANTQDIGSLSAGTYTVNITDNNGCTATASGTVYEPATAIDLDGNNDFVELGALLGNNSSYTKEAWVYLDSYNGHANNIISSRRAPFWINSGNGYKLTVSNGHGLSSATPISDGIAFPIQQWVYVAATYDATTQELKLYRNGALVASTNGATTHDGGDIWIGRYFSAGNNFEGKIDEVRLWDRALCQGEILNNMNCELNPAGQSGLLALYHLNQGYINANNAGVTNVTDASGNSNDGTLTNSSLNGANSNWTAGTASGTCGTFVPPTANITASGSTTICDGTTVTLTANTGNGYSYQWYLNGNTINGATNASYDAGAAGNYTVDVTVLGCTATSSATTVVVNPLTVFTACPTNISANTAQGQCSETVNYTATATGASTPSYSYVFTGATTGNGNGTGSGATFNTGVTNVLITASDICGTVTCSFTVTVVDNQNPTITCPADVTVNADNGACAATNVNLGAPTTTDNCGVQGTSNNGLSSYPVGTTVVTWTVTDIHGNTATCTQNVTVVDNQNPAAVCQPYALNLSNGAGLITPSDVDGGSSDNCGIASMSVSPNTFTCADAGENTVVLTVTDVNGNSSTCTTTVLVQYQPTCSIATTPSNNTYTGGNPNNIYLGYGPQSATITANATGGSGFSYSWSPAANLSCTNCQSPVYTPTAAGNYSYTVTVTNSNGCSTTCTVSFCVLDARAVDNKGKYNGKVYLCHVPPGNNSNPQTLSISANAVPSHLGQHSGDRLGTCNMSCNSSAKGGRSNGEEGAEEGHMHSVEELVAETGIRVYPNPNNGMFTLNLPSTEEAHILISNVSGQVVYRNKVSDTQKVSIDLSNNAQGIYMIQVVSGTDTYHARVNIQQ